LEPVTALALSPDGRVVYAASRSLQVRAFDLAGSGSAAAGADGAAAPPRELRAFRGHRAPVAAMAVHPSGGLLATASADRSARVWDADGGFCTHALTGHAGVVLAVAFHPTELLLLTGGDDAQVRVWDSSVLGLIYRRLIFSPLLTYILAALLHPQVRVWDLVTKTCRAVLKAHFSAVTCLALSPDGWTLLSGGRDGVVVAWSLKDDSKLATIPVFEAVEGLVALAAGGVAAGGAAGAPARRWPGVPRAAPGAPPPLCFATGGEKGLVKLWRADTGACVHAGGGPGAPPPAAGGVVELSAAPGGALLAATADCRLLLLRPAAGGAGVEAARELIGNNDEVTDVRFVPQPPPGADAAAAVPPPLLLAVATNSEHVRLFDAATLSCVATLAGHRDAVLCLDACLATGSGTAAAAVPLLASGSKDREVRVWRAARGGACLAVGAGHVGAVSALAFARRGSGFLVSGGADKLLKVWDVAGLLAGGGAGGAAEEEEGAKEAPARLRATAAAAAHDRDVNALAVAPNDALLASASQDRTCKVWRLPDLVLLRTLRGHKRGVWAAAFSPADQAVATASGDRTLRLWSLRDGTCLRAFEGHGASALRVEFAAGGARLLSAGADGLLKLWAARSGECLRTWDAHDGKAWALAAAPPPPPGAHGNALALATGGADGGLALWEDCTGADAAEAAAARADAVAQEQRLADALKGHDWGKAAALALKARHPGRLLAVVRAALAAGEAEAAAVLARVAAGLDADGLRLALECAREWNTNARAAAPAQALLHAVLRARRPEELLALPGSAALIDGLAPYTARHFARADRLLRSTYLADFVLGALSALAPDEEEEEEAAAAARGGAAAAAAAAAPTANGHHAPAANDAAGRSSSDEEAAASSSDEEGFGAPAPAPPSARRTRGRDAAPTPAPRGKRPAAEAAAAAREPTPKPKKAKAAAAKSANKSPPKSVAKAPKSAAKTPARRRKSD
jgi:U3 small nucleolar RNA-associated protein 13